MDPFLELLRELLRDRAYGAAMINQAAKTQDSGGMLPP